MLISLSLSLPPSLRLLVTSRACERTVLRTYGGPEPEYIFRTAVCVTNDLDVSTYPRNDTERTPRDIIIITWFDAFGCLGAVTANDSCPVVKRRRRTRFRPRRYSRRDPRRSSLKRRNRRRDNVYTRIRSDACAPSRL